MPKHALAFHFPSFHLTSTNVIANKLEMLNKIDIKLKFSIQTT